MQIIISGILGRMGKATLELSVNEPISVIAGFDLRDTEIDGIPVHSTTDNLPRNADCVIDFSSPAGTLAIVHWCERNTIPLVSGTTGLTDNEMEELARSSKRIPILWSSNMSVGICAIKSIVKNLSKIFQDTDIEIEELHHRNKADSPSGTALAIANTIIETKGWDKKDLIFGREGKVGQRPKKQIAIHSIRGGNIVGEHRILFLMDEEEITITHKALSRKLFAAGALKIARWLVNQRPGMYKIEDYVNQMT